RAQPSKEKPGNQGPAGGGERQRNAADLVNYGAKQSADRDCRTNERHIRHIGGSVWVTQHFGGGRNVLRPPDDGNNIAAVQLGVGQDRNVRGGRPSRDLAQEDAARRRRFRQLDQSFAVGLFARNVDIDAFDRHRQQLAVVHLLRGLPDQVHQYVAPPGNGEDIARLDYGIGSGIDDLAAASYAFNEDTLFRQERLGFLHRLAHGASVFRDPVGAQLELVPGRPRAAQGPLAPMLLLITLAGRLKVDAEQGRPEQGEHDGGPDRAKDVGDGVGHRHGVQELFALLGWQAQAVDGVGGKPHRGRDRLRAGIEARGGADVIAGEFRPGIGREQTEDADNRGKQRLRHAILGDAAHELRAHPVADGEQEHQEEGGLDRPGNRDAELTDEDRGNQRRRHRAKAQPLVGEGTEIVAKRQGQEDRNFRITAQRINKPIDHDAYH